MKLMLTDADTRRPEKEVAADLSDKTSTVRTRGRSLATLTNPLAVPLIGLLLVAGCGTPPPRPAVPAAQESMPAVAVSPSPSAQIRDEAKPDIKLAISPEIKPTPEPAINIEDNNIFFEHGSTLVAEIEKEKLRQHAIRLKQSPKIHVTLTGYSDDLGSRNYKLAIAEERLVAVSKLLQSYGVSPRQIRRNRSASVKNSPPCSTGDCRRLRRRVELVYPK